MFYFCKKYTLPARTKYQRTFNKLFLATFRAFLTRSIERCAEISSKFVNTSRSTFLYRLIGYPLK